MSMLTIPQNEVEQFQAMLTDRRRRSWLGRRVRALEALGSCVLDTRTVAHLVESTTRATRAVLVSMRKDGLVIGDLAVHPETHRISIFWSMTPKGRELLLTAL